MKTDDAEHDAVLATGVPGIVIWRYPRRTLTTKAGKVRSRYYSVTHEPSGYALLPGTTRGGHKVSLRLDEALKVARQLGDVRYRRRPIDWTLPEDQLMAIERVRTACMTAAGWLRFTPDYDKETRAWAERNGINLDWPTKATL